MLNVLNELIKAIENRQTVALATIIDVQGASPAQVGFKLLVWPDGRCVGNVGGGELEKPKASFYGWIFPKASFYGWIFQFGPQSNVRGARLLAAFLMR